MMAIRNLFQTRASTAVIIIRIAVGVVFVSEGVQKLLFPAVRGAGRFADFGYPAPDLIATLVAVVEIVAGLLVLFGFLTRIAAILLIIDMSAAILTTKLPILLGHELWLFALRDTDIPGIWGFLHEFRTDFAMLAGSIYLLIVGAGDWSLDAYLQHYRTDAGSQSTPHTED